MLDGPHIQLWRLLSSADVQNQGTKEGSHLEGNWATAKEEISDTNTLWRQYNILVELYRYYIDLAWKASVWYYTAVAISLVYLLGHLNPMHPSYLPLLLLFLSGMSGGLLLIFASTFRHLHEMENWLEHIAIQLHLPGRPHTEFLLSYLKLTCMLFSLAALSCLGLFVFIYLHA
jgi:hypothetical protein